MNRVKRTGFKCLAGPTVVSTHHQNTRTCNIALRKHRLKYSQGTYVIEREKISNAITKGTWLAQESVGRSIFVMQENKIANTCIVLLTFFC